MKKKLFGYLMAGLLLLCSADSFAQSLRTPKKGKSKSENKQQVRKFVSYQRMFNELPRPRSHSGIIARPEHRFIKKGDSTRVKVLFGNSCEYVSIAGQTTTKEDLKNGEFIATIKPDSTQIMTIRFKFNYDKFEDTLKFVILVFEEEEYKKVAAKFKEFEDDEDANGRDYYILDLQGDLKNKIYTR